MTMRPPSPAIYIALRAAQSGTWIMPVVVVFWQRAGLTLAEVFLLQAAFSAAAFLLEVPTGVLADRWGRGRCLALGFAVWAAAMAAYPFAGSFAAFLALELVVAVGVCLASGADTALLYDSLLVSGREDEFPAWQGRVSAAGYWAEAAAALAGGALALWSLSLPFWAYAAQLGAAAVASLGLSDARPAPVGDKRAYWRDLLRAPGLPAAFALYAVASTGTLVAAWFYQPLWQSHLIPLAWFGPLWAACLIASGTAAQLTPRLTAAWGAPWVLAAGALAPGVGLILLGAGPVAVAVPLCLLISAARGINSTLLVDRIHRRVGSSMRASAHSLMLAGGRLAFFIIGPAAGKTADMAGLPWALAATGAVLAVAAWAALRRLPRDLVVPPKGQLLVESAA